MEDFLGYEMKFKLQNREIIGVLETWDGYKETVCIRIQDKKEIINIKDINDLELCDYSVTSKDTENEKHEGSNISENKNNDESVTSKDTENEKHEGSNISENKNNDESVNVKDTRVSTGCISNEGVTVRNTSITVKDKENCVDDPKSNDMETEFLNDTKVVKNKEEYTDKRHNTTLSIDEYNLFLQDCFSVYGPTEEEFIAYVSLSIWKILRSKSSDKQVTIKMGSNSLYNCLGYTLGRLLVVRGSEVYIIEDREDMNVVKYKYTYEQNCSSKNKNSLTCINFSDEEVQGFDVVYCINCRHTRCIKLSLGCIIKKEENESNEENERKKECGEENEREKECGGYIIDINASQKVYEKYKMRREFFDQEFLEYNNLADKKDDA